MSMNITCQQYDLSLDPDIRQAAPYEDLQICFYALRSAELNSLSELYQDWLTLFENDPHSDLKQHPDYLAHLLPQLQASFPDRPSYLMLCRQQGIPVAAGICCPKDVSTKTLRGIGPACQLRGYFLSGNGFLLQEDFQDNETFLAFLLDTTLKFCQRQQATFLFLEDVFIDSPLKHGLDQIEGDCLTYSHTGFQPRSLIRFPNNPADYWNQFRSRSRRKHRKTIRNNSQLELVRVTEPDQVADFLSAAHQVSLNTWQTQRLGLRVKNNDKELNELLFLALHGALRSYLLLDGDRPVAFKVSSQHRGTFHDLEFGYDLDYARQSPGETLLLLILEDLTQHDSPRRYDFGEGDAMYKQRFSSEITQSGSVVLFPKTVKNRSLLCHLNSSSLLDRSVRKILKASGFYTALRQLVRYRKLSSR
ncbi:hypothetical protein Pan153_32800 [Gimesia panareensis]|uniref:BioF2-like acetyltransferase domain-containing protein n=1 Tax=Gimesia panareensis TaxID=2527978 RepID=A0A518FQJ1_9PLAN|nr:GNAT family N-acetyltransferase [Gimesia panareensis]QDV18621.1 hypothetical protein Pan153_32800 [Gimesia panareensis]